jgi:hypothetical protein
VETSILVSPSGPDILEERTSLQQPTGTPLLFLAELTTRHQLESSENRRWEEQEVKRESKCLGENRARG